MSDPNTFSASGGAIEDAPVSTLFDRLLKDAQQEVAKPNFRVPIEDVRPGYQLIFSGDLPKPQLERWQEACRKVPGKDDVNSQKLAKILIARQCIAIRLNDEDVIDSAGQKVTFDTVELQNSLGCPGRGDEAAAKFIGKDGKVEAVALAILRGTGYQSEADSSPLDS